MIVIEPGSAKNFKSAGLNKRDLSRFLKEVCAAIALRGRVDVLLTGDQGVRRLNRDFRKKNKPTDVLSFPALVEPALRNSAAGDLAISLETAALQAESFGHSLDIEIKVLMLHGVLHLSGFDHETDAGEMAAREAALRVELGLPAGLIQRSGQQ